VFFLIILKLYNLELPLKLSLYPWRQERRWFTKHWFPGYSAMWHSCWL